MAPIHKHPSFNQRASDQTRVAQVAENAMLKAAARFGMVLLTLICLPIGGWLANRVVGTLDVIVAKLETVTLSVNTNTTEIKHLGETDNEVKRRLNWLERERRSALDPETAPN